MDKNLPENLTSVHIRLHLGPSSELKKVSQALDDLTKVIQTGAKSRKNYDLKEFVSKKGANLSKSEAAQVRREFNKSSDYSVRVQELDYKNPINMTLLNISPVAVLLLMQSTLRFFGIWKSARRIASAQATSAESKASLDQAKANIYSQLTSEYGEQLRRTPFPIDLDRQTLTDSLLDALERLSKLDISIEIIPKEDDVDL